MMTVPLTLPLGGIVVRVIGAVKIDPVPVYSS